MGNVRSDVGTYWGNGGLHKDVVEVLKPFKLSFGYTGNPLVDAHQALSNIYYERYNNGGTNYHMSEREWRRDPSLERYYGGTLKNKIEGIEGFGVISLSRVFSNNDNDSLNYLEDKMDKLLELIKNQIVEHGVEILNPPHPEQMITMYVSHDEEVYSMSPMGVAGEFSMTWWSESLPEYYDERMKLYKNWGYEFKG